MYGIISTIYQITQMELIFTFKLENRRYETFNVEVPKMS